MGVSYEGMKLVWLKQSGGKTTTIAWISPDEGSLGSFSGGSKVSVPVKVRVINGPKPVFSLVNGDLPPGLTFSTETGAITGTPENISGDYSFTLRATSGQATIERAFQIALATNLPPVWTTTTGSLGSPFDSTDYDYNLEAIDPEGQPVTYSLVTGSLPGGLKLNPTTGEIKGRLRYVNANTTFYFTVKASDGLASTNESFNITVKANEAPYWITSGNSNGDAITSFIEGVAHSFALEARDPEGSELTFSIKSGELPEGITLDPATGVLSGTMGTIQSNRKITISVLVSDGVKGAERAFTLGLAKNLPPVWTQLTPALVDVGGYNIILPLLASDPNGKPLTFALKEGSTLPAGLALIDDAIIGSLEEVSEATDIKFTIVASDGVLSTEKEIVIRALVNTAPIWASLSDLGEGRENVPFVTQLVATDPEDKQVTYVATTDLPSGLTLSETGLLTGTPTDVSEDTTFEFSVEASDGVLTAERDFSLLIKANVAPVWVTPAGSLDDANGLTRYSKTLEATDANGDGLTYALVTGELPPGIAIAGSSLVGIVGPNTTADQPYSFTLSVTDGNSTPVNRSFTINHTVNQPVVWNTAAGRIGEEFEKNSFSFKLDATDPEGKTVRYSIPQGAELPRGFSLNATTGVISGTLPTVSQDTPISFTIIASVPSDVLSDGRGTGVSRAFNILAKFNSAPEFVGPSDFTGVESRASTARVTAVNMGNGPMTYSVVSGALPTGLTLQSNGQITGNAPVATEDTTYAFVVRANNGIKTTDRAYTFKVAHNIAPAWTTAAGTLGAIYAGQNRNVALSASDANGQTVLYSLVSGALPQGMSLNPSTGVISGTPVIGTVDATSNFTIGASDGVLRTDRSFSLTVSANAAPTWLTAAGSLGEVVRNKNFSIALQAADAEGQKLTYSISEGSLPQGILLNPNTGAIVGRAPDVTEDEVYSFTVRVSDGILFADQAYSISVNMDAAPIWNTPAGSLGAVLSGYAGGFSFSATDPEGLPVTYTMVSGSLPAGWRFDAQNRAVKTSSTESSPITTADETFSFTLRASDGQVFSDRQFSVTVLKNLQPTWNVVYNTDLGSKLERSDIDFTVAATDLEGKPLVYTVTDGALPGGITLNASTGRVSGKLQFVESDTDFAFTIKAFDGRLYSDGLNYTLRVLFDSPPLWQTAAGSLGTALEDTEFSRTVVATSNGGEVIYGLKLGSTLPGTLTINDETGVISGKLPLVELDSVDYSFTLLATNAAGKSSERNFKIVVQDNVAPVWQTAGGLLITDLAGTAFSFVLNATDGNGTPITYSVVEGTLPTGVTFDVATHTLSGTLPAVETDTTYAITIGASDGNIRTDREFRFRSLKDTAPVWTTAENLGDVYEQAFYSTTLVAADGQNKPVTYTLKEGSVLPGTLTLVGTPIGGQSPVPAGRLSGTLPVNNVVGATDVYTFTVVASDGVFTTERTFTLNVKHNTAPVWTTNAGSLGFVVEGQSYSATLVATDPENKPVTYALKTGSVLPTGLTLNATTGVISGTAGSVATDTTTPFTVEAKDDLRTTERAFSITVSNAVAPVDTFSDNIVALLQMNGTTDDNTGKMVTKTSNKGRVGMWITNRLMNEAGEVAIDPANFKGVTENGPSQSGNGSLDFSGANSANSFVIYDYAYTNTGTPYMTRLNSGDFTIEAWFRTTPRGTSVQTVFAHAMSQFYDGGSRYGIASEYQPGVGMVVIIGRHDSTPVSTLTIPGNFADANWHHVAITRKNNVFRHFVDGVEAAATYTGSFEIAPYIQESCALGNKYGYVTGFNGQIDGFRITVGEALYSTAFTPSPTLAMPSAIGPVTSNDNVKTDFGSALKITAAGEGISIPHYSDFVVTNTDEFTLEAWVYPMVSGVGSIFSKANSSSVTIRLDQNNNAYMVYYNGVTLTANNAVVQGQWQHVAVVLKRGTGANVALYVNGVSVASAVIANTGFNTLAYEPMYIGTNHLGQSLVGGFIDEVRITKSARYTGTFVPAAIQTDPVPRVNTKQLVGTEKTAANYSISASDLGNTGLLTYSATDLPTGLSIAPTTGAISGTNPDAIHSAYPFKATVTDGKGNKSTRTVSIRPSYATSPDPLAFSWRLNDQTVGVSTPTSLFYSNKGSFTPNTVTRAKYVAAPGRTGEFALNINNGFFGRNGLTNELAVLNTNSTVEGWFYATAQSPNNCTFFSVAGTGIRIYAKNTGVVFDYAGTTQGSPMPLTLNAWHHVAVVRNGTEVKVYYDGTLWVTATAATIGLSDISFGTITLADGAQYVWQTNTYLRNWNIYSTAKYLSNFTPHFDNYNDPIWITASNAIPNGMVGEGVSANLVAQAAGGRTLTYTSADLPAGLTLSSAGVLGGVYPEASASFTVVATDSVGYATSRSFSVTVAQAFSPDPFAVYTRTLFSMTGTAGSVPVDARRNVSPITYSTAGQPQASIQQAQSKWGNGSLSLGGAHANATAPGVGSNAFAYYPAKAMGATDDFTVEAWVYPTSQNVSSPRNIIWSYFPAAPGIYLMLYGNAGSPMVASIGFNNGDPRLDGTTSVPLNQWTHIAMSRENGVFRLYTNGVKQGADTTYATSIGAEGGRFGLGGFEGASDYHSFKGYMNDFRLTHRKARYTGATFTVPAQGLDIKDANGVVPGLMSWSFNKGTLGATTAATAALMAPEAGIPTISAPSGTVQFVPSTTSVTPRNNLKFAAGSYVNMNTSTEMQFMSGDWTFETWVKLDSFTSSSGNASIVSISNSGQTVSLFRLFFWTAAGNGKLTASYNGASAQFDTSPATNTWAHLAVVRNGATLTCYLNGVPQASKATNVTSLAAASWNNVPMTINGWPTGGGWSVGAEYADYSFSNYAKYAGSFTPTPVSSDPIPAASVEHTFNKPVGPVSQADTVPDIGAVSASSLITTTNSANFIAFNGSKNVIKFDAGSRIALTTDALQFMSSSDWTFETFIKQDNADTDNLPVYMLSNTNQLLMAVNFYQKQFYFWNGSQWAGGGTAATYSSTNWNHIAVVKTGSTVNLFCNGVRLNPQSFANPTLAQLTGAKVGVNGDPRVNSNNASSAAAAYSKWSFTKGVKYVGATYTPPTM